MKLEESEEREYLLIFVNSRYYHQEVFVTQKIVDFEDDESFTILIHPCQLTSIVSRNDIPFLFFEGKYRYSFAFSSLDIKETFSLSSTAQESFRDYKGGGLYLLPSEVTVDDIVGKIQKFIERHKV